MRRKWDKLLSFRRLTPCTANPHTANPSTANPGAASKRSESETAGSLSACGTKPTQENVNEFSLHLNHLEDEVLPIRQGAILIFICKMIINKIQ